MRFLSLLLIICHFYSARAQSLYFPSASGSWDSLPASDLGWCNDSLNSLHQYLEDNNSKSFIILKDGKRVLEWYFHGFAQDSLWYWASAGKGVTAMLVGIAQEEGLLSITDTTASYLGDNWTSCEDSSEKKIRIWNQLTMTSGLNDGLGDPFCTFDTCLHCLAEPGSRWAYHNGPYTLLREVIENASNMNYNLFYYTRLANKVGMGGGWVKVGYNNLLFTKPRDMARFGLLSLAKGHWNGSPILRDSSYFQQMVSKSQELNKSYGYLWWLNGQGSYRLPGSQLEFPFDLIPNAPDDMYAALGKDDQKIYVVPSQNLVVIRMGEAAGLGVPTLSGFDNVLWKKISELGCTSTPIESSTNLPLLDVYPNPTQGPVYFSGAYHKLTVKVYNLLGQNLWQGEARDCNLSPYPNGIYLIEVGTPEGNRQTFRMIKGN